MSNKILLISIALLAGFCITQPCTAKSKVQTQSSNQSVTLDMQNMTCAMCKITIRKALEGVDGVQTVKVDSDSNTANITFNPQKTNIESLIQSTTNAGYPATVHPEK